MHKRWLRPKYAVFGVILLMIVYVVFHNERFVIHADDPAWKHYAGFKWWLLPHILSAACALFLGPMQFSERLRLRYRKLHRVLGRIYVGGVLVGAPLGTFIQYRFDEPLGTPRSLTISQIVEATLWVLPTLFGLFFAVRGKIKLHSQWMTRSYAVAIVFLQTRVIMGLGGWQVNPENAHILETVIWIGLAFAFLLADIAITWEENGLIRSTYSKAGARSTS